MDRFEPRRFVGYADRDRFLPSRGERGKRTIEKSRAVSEAIALGIEAVHRHQRKLGDDRVAGRWIGDVEPSLRQCVARLPEPELKRRARRDDHRERRARAALAKPVRQMAWIVFVADRPTDGDDAPGECGKCTLEMRVDRCAQPFDLRGIERKARLDQALSLGVAPRLQLLGVHAILNG